MIIATGWPGLLDCYTDISKDPVHNR